MNILKIDNLYIKRISEDNNSISNDSLLTLSRKSSRMVEENNRNALVPLLGNFEIIVCSNNLEEERRNPFIYDSKQDTPTISYLDVVDESQHEVTLTQDPE